MTEKRFDVGNLKIQDTAPKGRVYLLDMQGGVNALCSLINGLNDKSNRLEKENEQGKELMKNLKHDYDALHDVCSKLEKKVRCIQEEANDYCEELMGKDELIRLYKRHIDEVIEENKQLQAKIDCLDDIDRNCYNCKHCETYDEGPGYGFVSLCEKDCMNTDGYFDYEYHKFKSSVVCPFWEHGDDL